MLTNLIEIKEEEPIFEILFLKNDEEKYVEAYETNNVSCSDIIEHLNLGESVYISKKKIIQNKPEAKIAFNNPDTSLYLNRV